MVAQIQSCLQTLQNNGLDLYARSLYLFQIFAGLIVLLAGQTFSGNHLLAALNSFPGFTAAASKKQEIS